jgi:hypothetical protein
MTTVTLKEKNLTTVIRMLADKNVNIPWACSSYVELIFDLKGDESIPFGDSNYKNFKNS